MIEMYKELQDGGYLDMLEKNKEIYQHSFYFNFLIYSFKYNTSISIFKYYLRTLYILLDKNYWNNDKFDNSKFFFCKDLFLMLNIVEKHITASHLSSRPRIKDPEYVKISKNDFLKPAIVIISQ